MLVKSTVIWRQLRGHKPEVCRTILIAFTTRTFNTQRTQKPYCTRHWWICMQQSGTSIWAMLGCKKGTLADRGADRAEYSIWQRAACKHFVGCKTNDWKENFKANNPIQAFRSHPQTGHEAMEIHQQSNKCDRKEDRNGVPFSHIFYANIPHYSCRGNGRERARRNLFFFLLQRIHHVNFWLCAQHAT